MEVLKKNMSRHRRIKHNDDVPAGDANASASTRPRSRSSSTDTRRSETHRQPDSALGVTIDNEVALEAEEAMLERVAARIIEQHDIYTIPLLEKFVEERYSFIGADQRRALVIGATTGARHAARLHYMVTCYENSNSETKRRSAMNAKDVLCSWNFGPRQHLDQTPTPDPGVHTGASSTDTRPLTEQRSLAALGTDPLMLQLPVSYEACRAEFDMATAEITQSGIPTGPAAASVASGGALAVDSVVTTAAAVGAPESQAVVSSASAAGTTTTAGRPVSDSPYSPPYPTASVSDLTYVATPPAPLQARRQVLEVYDDSAQRRGDGTLTKQPVPDDGTDPNPHRDARTPPRQFISESDGGSAQRREARSPSRQHSQRDPSSNNSDRGRRAAVRRTSPQRRREPSRRRSPRNLSPGHLTLRGWELEEYRRFIASRR